MNSNLQKYYNKFIDKSQVIEKLRQKFSFVFTNQETGEVVEKVFEFRKYYFDLFNFYKNKVIYFSNLFDNKNYNFFFLTLTLPGEYHFFKQDKQSKTIVKNDKCWFGLNESIERGGEILYNTFRMFYKRLKDRIGYRKLDYIYFFEFHKSFTPHLHFLIVLDKSIDIKMIYQLFNKVIRDNRLNSVGCDIKKLSDNKHTINYVTKYITKTIKEIKENKSNFVYLLDGWKRTLGKRLFGSSRFLPFRSDWIKRIYRRFKSKIKKVKGFDVISKVKGFLEGKRLDIVEKIKEVKRVKIIVNGDVYDITKRELDNLLSKLSEVYRMDVGLIYHKMKQVFPNCFQDYLSKSNYLFNQGIFKFNECGIQGYYIKIEREYTRKVKEKRLVGVWINDNEYKQLDDWIVDFYIKNP